MDQLVVHVGGRGRRREADQGEQNDCTANNQAHGVTPLYERCPKRSNADSGVRPRTSATTQNVRRTRVVPIHISVGFIAQVVSRSPRYYWK